MNERVIQIMLALIRRVVCGTELDGEVKAWLTPELMPQLYELSGAHDMSHIVARGLSELGMLGSDEASQKFKKQHMLAIYRCRQIEYELERICHSLEAAQIRYLPLKGSVIRKYYPESWMRTSCDIDVLVREEDLERAIDALTEGLNYKNKGRGTHDVSLYSESGVHVELHYDLIEEVRYPNVVALLKRVWDYAEVADGATYQHRLQDEMFYFYHVVHMAKHFENGGCGVRSVLDQWILDCCVEHDDKARKALLQACGMETFGAATGALAAVWFSQEAHNELTAATEQYILRGGIYGTVENGIAVRRVKKGSPLRYVLSRLFLPYEIMKLQYPILEKHKWLLPVMQVRRWIRAIFSGRTKHVMNEFSVNQTISQEQVSDVASLLQRLGLQ